MCHLITKIKIVYFLFKGKKFFSSSTVLQGSVNAKHNYLKSLDHKIFSFYILTWVSKIKQDSRNIIIRDKAFFVFMNTITDTRKIILLIQ